MELRHIRYFVAAAEQLHFGRAADVLAVTRPAVSQTVADLEAEMGVRLFARQGQKVYLTAAGETFLKHARLILQDVSTAVKSTKRVGQGKLGILTVGYGSLGLRQPLFREAVKKMGSEYPDTDLVLRELVSRVQIEDVRSGKLDAGFVYVAHNEAEQAISVPGQDSLRDLQSLVIETGTLAVALPNDHPMASATSLNLNELSDEGFIVVGSSIVNPYFAFVPKVIQEVGNISTQINLISVGMGVGLVVNSPNLQYPPDICVVPLRDLSHMSEFRLIWRREATEPILQNFIDIVAGLAQGY